jgi:hypothetical protein
VTCNVKGGEWLSEASDSGSSVCKAACLVYFLPDAHKSLTLICASDITAGPFFFSRGGTSRMKRAGVQCCRWLSEASDSGSWPHTMPPISHFCPMHKISLCCVTSDSWPLSEEAQAAGSAGVQSDKGGGWLREIETEGHRTACYLCVHRLRKIVRTSSKKSKHWDVGSIAHLNHCLIPSMSHPPSSALSTISTVSL